MKQIKFGTGGFRAVIGEDFTKRNVQGVCQAMANIMNAKGYKKEICIGYDNRFMSEYFAKWCGEVFAGNGIRVELFDRATSTPVAMYATKVKKNDYGVMITASHNPFEYNGVKIFVAGGKDAGADETAEVEKEMGKVSVIKRVDYESAVGKNIILVNYLDQYVESIINFLDIRNCGQNIKVVYDAKFGSTVEELELFSRQMGIKNTEIINGKRDALFGMKLPAPSADNISELRERVVASKADIGFALDADGDRLAVIDENGQYVDNNYILAIVYYFLVKYCGKKGDSVKNVATSNLLDKVSEKLGFVCHEVPVGFKYVSSALMEFDAVIGGESSGGLAIDGHILGKDSLLAIALCLKAMVVMNKSFSQILKEVKDFVGGYEKIIFDKQYSYTAEQKKHIDSILFEKRITPQHRYALKDVVIESHVKVYYENGNWSLIRFSGTEPILRIFVESDSQEENMKMVEDWEKLLKI